MEMEMTLESRDISERLRLKCDNCQINFDMKIIQDYCYIDNDLKMIGPQRERYEIIKLSYDVITMNDGGGEIVVAAESEDYGGFTLI